MKRETIIFTACGFLLGLTLGSFVIGPKIASSKLAGAPVVAESAPVETSSAPVTATGNPMGAVMQQLASLKEAVAKNPKDADALAQLGDMYMQAAKFPQAAEYLERALAVRDDAALRMDLGICYKQTNQPQKALTEFQRSASMAPDQWQPLFYEAVTLMEMQRMDEARAIAAKVQKMRPDDSDVQKLVATLNAK